MNRFYSAGLLVPALLCLACSNDPSSVSSESPATSATFIANGTQSVVVQTDEVDRNGDGTADATFITTTRYDVHGNAVEEVSESPASRDVTTNQYNNHGDLIGYVYDEDEGADGVVDARETLTTLETDNQGHPLRQAVSYDDGNNGSIELTSERANRFDARGRIVEVTRSNQSDAYQYDEHDNVARHDMHWAQGSRAINLVYNGEWSAHSSELRSASTVTQTGQPESGHTLTSIAFDKQGYPILQNLEFRSGSRVSSRFTIEWGYDGHHRVLLHVASEDRNLDGQIDSRTTTRFEYGGPEVAAAHGLAALGKAGRAGAALVSQRFNGKGPSGPPEGRFSR